MHAHATGRPRVLITGMAESHVVEQHKGEMTFAGHLADALRHCDYRVSVKPTHPEELDTGRGQDPLADVDVLLVGIAPTDPKTGRHTYGAWAAIASAESRRLAVGFFVDDHDAENIGGSAVWHLDTPEEAVLVDGSEMGLLQL